MTTYIIRRLIQGIGVLILVTALVFFVMRLLPGDPLIIYVAQSAQLESMSIEAVESLRHEYGLDKHIITQYFNWIANIFRGDLGTSIYYHDKVSTLMLERFPVTAYIGFLSLIVSAIFGILAGLIAAVRRGKLQDKIIKKNIKVRRENVSDS